MSLASLRPSSTAISKSTSTSCYPGTSKPQATLTLEAILQFMQIDALVVPAIALNVAKVQKAQPKAPGALVCRQTFKPVSNLFVLIAQHRAVAITRLTDLECAAGQRNADPIPIDLHEHLVQVPLPVRKGSHLADPANFPCEFQRQKWAKSVPPKSNRFVADVDTAFVQKILHISKR